MKDEEERASDMGMQRVERLMKYLSIPVLMCGLFLTFLADMALYRADVRMGREALTGSAERRLNSFHEYVYRYETAADIIGSTVQSNEGRTDGLSGMSRLLEINRSIRLIEVIPEKGDSTWFTADRWLGSGRSMLEGPLKEAAHEARSERQTVFVDSLPWTMSGPIWRCCSPFFWRIGHLPCSGGMC